METFSWMGDDCHYPFPNPACYNHCRRQFIMGNIIKAPEGGEKITIQDGKLQVPEAAIIPFVEGDGTGRDIWRASRRVLEAAVEKAYQGKRKITWMEVYAGEKDFNLFGTWLPDETVAAFQEFRVGIKGPLTTPIGGGIRSLNVALRKALDLYVCLRPPPPPGEAPNPRAPRAPGLGVKAALAPGPRRARRGGDPMGPRQPAAVGDL